MAYQTIAGGTFDGTPTPVQNSSAWTRILTLGTLQKNKVVGIDIAPVANAVKIRLTRAAKAGENHGVLQTDLTQVGRYVLLATNNGTGTVNQPNAEDIVSLNVNTEGSAEIGVEAQCVSAAAIVRAYGSVND